MKTRVTANTSATVERVINLLMTHKGYSRAQAGELLLQWGTQAVVEDLKSRKILQEAFAAVEEQP